VRRAVRDSPRGPRWREATPAGAASGASIGPGTYAFTTTGAEQVIVLTGSLAVRLPGEDWRSVHAPGAYVVPPATTFEVSADTDVSYLCRFAASADGPLPKRPEAQ